MNLVVVPPNFVDYAWKDGAHQLSQACDTVDEITGDQLKMILARGERTLVVLMDGDDKVGWGAFRVDALPNMRVLHITDLYAPGKHFETFFSDIKEIAFSMGCSRVRCAALPAQARLYRMKSGFKPVYEILEVAL